MLGSRCRWHLSQAFGCKSSGTNGMILHSFALSRLPFMFSGWFNPLFRCLPLARIPLALHLMHSPCPFHACMMASSLGSFRDSCALHLESKERDSWCLNLEPYAICIHMIFPCWHVHHSKYINPWDLGALMQHGYMAGSVASFWLSRLLGLKIAWLLRASNSKAPSAGSKFSPRQWWRLTQ